MKYLYGVFFDDIYNKHKVKCLSGLKPTTFEMVTTGPPLFHYFITTVLKYGENIVIKPPKNPNQSRNQNHVTSINLHWAGLGVVVDYSPNPYTETKAVSQMWDLYNLITYMMLVLTIFIKVRFVSKCPRYVTIIG